MPSSEDKAEGQTEDLYGDNPEDSPAEESPVPAENAKKKRGRPKSTVPKAVPAVTSAVGESPKKRGRPPGQSKKKKGGTRMGGEGGGGGGGDNKVEMKENDVGADVETGEPVLSEGRPMQCLLVAVDPGEDIAGAVQKTVDKYGKKMCVLSVTGSVSDAKLLAVDNKSQVLCKGMFQIVSMSGLLEPHTSSTTSHTNSGNSLSVGIASDEGQMLGGALAGEMLAATRCKVVLGTIF